MAKDRFYHSGDHQIRNIVLANRILLSVANKAELKPAELTEKELAQQEADRMIAHIRYLCDVSGKKPREIAQIMNLPITQIYRITAGLTRAFVVARKSDSLPVS